MVPEDAFAQTLLHLMRQESLPALLAEGVGVALQVSGAEGAYLLARREGRYQVVAAEGSAAPARGLFLPPEWSPKAGNTPPPGPLGFSPDGRERTGYLVADGEHLLALEGLPPPPEEVRERLALLLEALTLRAGRLARLQSWAVLQEVAQELHSGALAEEVAERFLQSLLRFLPLEAALLFRVEGGFYRPWLSAGKVPEAYLEAHRRHPVRVGEGVDREALGLRRPVVVYDYQAHPLALEPFKAAGLRTVVFCLFQKGERVFGALGLASFSRPVPLDLESLAFLHMAKEVFAGWLSQVWHAEALMESFARLMERLDLETEGHMRRVSRLAVELGRRVGVEDLFGLRLGAYLHDLGKLAIPEEILHKEGPLVTREWRVVKAHPEVGHEVLAPVPFLPKTALEVVLYHHEHWDGTGYPRGLKGEEIPLPARVFAVVDVWDALRSKRPYKPALSPEEAKELLRKEAGRKLEPRLVEAFLALLEEGALDEEARER